MSAPAPAAIAEELEAAREKRMKNHREQAEAAAASSESPRPPVTPDSKPEPPAPVAPETLTSPAVAAGKERKRKKEVAAALVKVAVRKEEKMKCKRNKHEEEAAPTPSPSVASKILEVAAEGAMERKEWRRFKAEQGQSGLPPVPDDVHPQVGEAAADDGVSGNQSVQWSRSGKPLVRTASEILKIKIETLKQQQMPRFIPTMPNFNSIEHDPNYSSPFGAFFDQFRYKPERRQGHNAPSVPKMSYRPARPPTRDRPPSLSDQLTANDTFMAAKTAISDTEQPHSASASVSQEEVKVKAKKGSEKMDGMKKPRKPVLTKADMQLDMYRRLPLDKLVSPPHSPHKLLQEGYADDPWKVIVICMLLNLTQGKQVKEKVEGFFKRYPDAQTAYTADPDKMAEYLTPLGLQRVKANRIQKFSKAYIGEEWQYVTELCGVGKYAADAYAIFCAGRAKDVVPKDHKLVDYWKYVRFELPSTQASQNVQE